LKGSPHNFRKLTGEESKKVRAAVISAPCNKAAIKKEAASSEAAPDI